MSWPIVKLGSVSERIDYGLTASAIEAVDGPRFLRITDMQDDTVDWETVPSCECSSKEFEDNSLKEGDIVFARTGATTGKSYLIRELMKPAVFASYLIRVRPDHNVDATFLSYFFKSSWYWHQITSLANGAAQPGVNSTKLKELEIPLPPLAEQKRIAAILDKADAIRRKRQQAIQLADEFLRSVFLDMFGDLVTAKGYEKSRKHKIRDLVDYIDYRGKTPQKSDSGVPLVTAKNVKKGYIDQEPREYIPESNYQAWMTRGLPLENDVLFTTEAPLGNVALLGKYEKVVIGQRLISLRSKGKVTHEFLMYLLLHPFIQGLILNRSSGSTVKGIRTKELYEIELPVPELQLQELFTNIYFQVNSLNQKEQKSLCSHSEIFNSLSQKAFSGQL